MADLFGLRRIGRVDSQGVMRADGDRFVELEPVKGIEGLFNTPVSPDDSRKVVGGALLVFTVYSSLFGPLG